MDRYEGKHKIQAEIEVIQDHPDGPFGDRWYWKFSGENSLRGPFESARAAYEDATSMRPTLRFSA